MVQGEFIPLEPCRFFLKKKTTTKKSFIFDNINKRQISLTYINETISMINILKDHVYTYEYRRIITSI